jgi:hypothetical protein
MSTKVFDYNHLTKICVRCNAGLLERISENIESPVNSSIADCTIKINQSNPTIEIVKDKSFDYQTIEKQERDGGVSIKYRRYNTLVRTIHPEASGNYTVDTNLGYDEASGLICLRDHLSNHPGLLGKPLLHASLIEINGKGVLISGDSRQGKTTSAVYFIQKQGAVFISDENVILDNSEGILQGIYIPRTIRVRFSTIAHSDLSNVLEDVNLARATQYIDPDAIKNIIRTGNYQVDAGLAFSRRAFCELLGTTSKEKTPIKMVVFPKFSSTNQVKLHKLSKAEGVERLEKSGLIRKTEIDSKELSGLRVKLKKTDYSEIEFVELEFSEISNLLNGGIQL